jgi:pimeloyl-ACP methyl ester carboxylesterase
MTPSQDSPRAYGLTLPGRGTGEMAVIDFGPPSRAVDLVFLHANGFNAFTYRRLLAPLAADWRILAIDQRGHGATTLPADPVGRDDWIDLRDDLLAAFAALELRDVVLSGHSMGGTVSLLAAAHRRDLARALVLLDPVMIEAPTRTPGAEPSPMVAAALRRRPTFPTREAALIAYRGRGAFTTWPEAMLEDYLAAGLLAAADGGFSLACTPQWEASNYAAQGHDSWGALAAYEGPVTILGAETGSTLHIPERLADGGLPPGVRLERLAGSTHFLPMEHPERVRQALTSALEARA